MPVGTSDGEVFADDFHQIADMHGLLQTDPNATPKPGQTVQKPIISPGQPELQAAQFFGNALLPDSLKPEDRPLQNMPDTPQKIPEVENPALKIAQGATDIVGNLIPEVATSKAMFLGVAGMKNLLGDFALNNTLTRAENIVSAAKKAGVSIADPQVASELSLKTGLTVGADNMLRYEIPSHRAHVIESNMISTDSGALSPGPGNTVGDIFHHPELFAAYPDIAKIPVYPLSPELKGKAIGAFSNNHIELSPLQPEDLRQVMLHELQHVVQAKEGFARGGSTMEFMPDLETRLSLSDSEYNKTVEEAKDKYTKLAGEVEARNVMTRRDFNILQRARILPKTTEDVPRKDQVVRFK